MAMWVLAVLLLLSVVAAWMKLRPSARERVRARLRGEALAQGLRVRWLPASEARALGLPEAEAACWYQLPAAGAAQAEPLVLARREGAWPMAAVAGVDLAALPADIIAVRVAADGPALLWREPADGSVAELAALLRALSAGPALPPRSAGH